MAGVMIACIGECMIELDKVDLEQGTARLGFAGDTLNTALPSCDDEERLYPGLSPSQVIDRISGLGPDEAVLKNGARGPMIRFDGASVQTAMARAERVVDTSGAGDSFNAGYLAARLARAEPVQAAVAGHRLASTVIAHHGVVIPREAMPVLWQAAQKVRNDRNGSENYTIYSVSLA